MFIQPRHRRSVRGLSSKKRRVCSRRSSHKAFFVCGARAALTFAHISCRVKRRGALCGVDTGIKWESSSAGEVDARESDGGAVNQRRPAAQQSAPRRPRLLTGLDKWRSYRQKINNKSHCRRADSTRLQFFRLFTSFFNISQTCKPDGPPRPPIRTIENRGADAFAVAAPRISPWRWPQLE